MCGNTPKGVGDVNLGGKYTGPVCRQEHTACLIEADHVVVERKNKRVPSFLLKLLSGIS